MRIQTKTHIKVNQTCDKDQISALVAFICQEPRHKPHKQTETHANQSQTTRLTK